MEPKGTSDVSLLRNTPDLSFPLPSLTSVAISLFSVLPPQFSLSLFQYPSVSSVRAERKPL